jgi:Tfp pilus assembly protein PilV
MAAAVRLACRLQPTDLVRERGFCLVEVLIAATIVIVAIAGLGQLFVISSVANQRARSRTIATVLATAKMEELRAAANAPASGLDYADARGMLSDHGAGPAPGASYVRRWSAAAMPANPRAFILDVQVMFPQASPGETVRISGLKVSRVP